jgi:hypothetical protein
VSFKVPKFDFGEESPAKPAKAANPPQGEYPVPSTSATAGTESPNIHHDQEIKTAPECILTCSECPWHRANPWTHYPELPSWCDWHFDHLLADNPACIGYRRGELPAPGSVFVQGENPVSAESATPTCGDCVHFLCSPINPLRGFGRCAQAGVSGRPGAYPGREACRYFEGRVAETQAKY